MYFYFFVINQIDHLIFKYINRLIIFDNLSTKTMNNFINLNQDKSSLRVLIVCILIICIRIISVCGCDCQSHFVTATELREKTNGTIYRYFTSPPYPHQLRQTVCSYRIFVERLNADEELEFCVPPLHN